MNAGVDDVRIDDVTDVIVDVKIDDVKIVEVILDMRIKDIKISMRIEDMRIKDIKVDIIVFISHMVQIKRIWNAKV